MSACAGSSSRWGTPTTATSSSSSVLVTRNDFCRVGDTAPKTKEMVKKAMCARAMQACRTCLLLINAKRDMEGKSGWEERDAALLELLETLFDTALV